MPADAIPKAISDMKITASLFEAGLKCLTKCFLLSRGEHGFDNVYANWVRSRNESYQREAIDHLTARMESVKYASERSDTKEFMEAKWRFIMNATVQAHNIKSTVPMVECTTAGQDNAVQYVPTRFVYTNKLARDEKLRVAFDALVLSGMLGRTVDVGKIVHGNGYVRATVKTGLLVSEVQKFAASISKVLSAQSPPDLVLQRHCHECEFEARCRQNAKEKEDLSLLAGMSQRERKELNSKGIFTITHLSYTFRPRRRPKRFAGRAERYHHSLRGLAIREGKVHVVGTEELKIAGTPVYIDVEGLPDRDFYYLIGLRIGADPAAIQHSLWADPPENEEEIWHRLIDLVSVVHDPVIIHYGGFETAFFKRMRERYGGPHKESITGQAFTNSINVLSFIFARIYFPTYSNGLKEIAGYLGFAWSEKEPLGTTTIMWRNEWEKSGEASLKQRLIDYNAEDCGALACVTHFVTELSATKARLPERVIDVDSLPIDGFLKFGKTRYLLPALEEINRAAYWDYQREKIILKSDKRFKEIARVSAQKRRPSLKANSVIYWPRPSACPTCGRSTLYRRETSTKRVIDIKFGESGIERWVTTYIFRRYKCPTCTTIFVNPDHPWDQGKYGRNLLRFFAYLNIELHVPQRRVGRFLSEVLGFRFASNTAHLLKAKIVLMYKQTYENLLRKIIGGRLIHADETKINLLHGRMGYIWAFTSMEDVAYVYTPSREGQLVQTLLKDFNGVLVTDFYTAYDSIDCPQQKCLLHLIRDLNDGLMKEPFNVELKELMRAFADLVRPMIETADRLGLRAQFLQKHKIEVEAFFNDLSRKEYRTELAEKCKQRLEKNRKGLFTFLDYDGVPWNNNNAEHAIKAVARLRENLGSLSTEDAIQDYMILLSVSETCRFKGVNFLEFMCSGEQDIDTYATTKIKGPTRRNQTHPPLKKPVRRTFTTAYKLRIVKESWNCGRGQISALLRKERLDASCLRRWRRQVGQLLALAERHPRGLDLNAQRIRELKRENEKLKYKLKRAESSAIQNSGQG